MGEAVEQRRGDFGVAEDGGPFGEAEIGGDDNACALVEPAQQMEEQRPARGAEGQVSKLIQDDQIKACQVVSDLPGLAAHLFLLKGIDQLDGREEAHLFAMVFDGLDTEGGRDMRFPCARPPDQYDILGAIEEVTPVELPNQGLVYIAGSEVHNPEALIPVSHQL